MSQGRRAPRRASIENVDLVCHLQKLTSSHLRVHCILYMYVCGDTVVVGSISARGKFWVNYISISTLLHEVDLVGNGESIALMVNDFT